MIKKQVVCDRCEKEKPCIIIRDSKKLGKNSVLCERCAEYYYDLSHKKIECCGCGKVLCGMDVFEGRYAFYCSLECAVSVIEGCGVEKYTQEHEQKLLESKEKGDEEK
jgi:hypothetical protein